MPKVKLLIVVEGGVIQDILSEQEPDNIEVDIILKDMDILCDGTPFTGEVNYGVQVKSKEEFAKEIFADVPLA